MVVKTTIFLFAKTQKMPYKYKYKKKYYKEQDNTLEILIFLLLVWFLLFIKSI